MSSCETLTCRVLAESDQKSRRWGVCPKLGNNPCVCLDCEERQDLLWRKARTLIARNRSPNSRQRTSRQLRQASAPLRCPLHFLESQQWEQSALFASLTLQHSCSAVACSEHHCSVSLKKIELCFLPLNATVVLHPLDQGIIRAFMVEYWKCVIERLLAKMCLNDKLKINLLTEIEIISHAWQDATCDIIRNCFHYVRLCQQGTEVASALHGNIDIATLWEELADTMDALPEMLP